MRSFQSGQYTFLNYTEMDESMVMKVWQCRNLPEIRKFMLNKEPISYANHINFVNSLKGKNNDLYYAVVKDGDLIGSVNLHISGNNVAERGIYLNPIFIGMGLSKLICIEFYKYAFEKIGIRYISTTVLKDNINSNALERSLGGEIVSEDEEFVHYLLDLKLFVSKYGGC